jgi:hypothetical protein
MEYEDLGVVCVADGDALEVIASSGSEDEQDCD